MLNRKLIVVLVGHNFLNILVIVFALAAGLWLFNQCSVRTSLPLSGMVSGKKVVIDAGHGGGDPGAKSNSGLVEKKLNLDIALKLKKYLSRVGVYCIMIRETDRDFFDASNGITHKKRRDLIHRTQIANQSRADLYLSIHANSFPQTIYRGAQTFYEKNNPESRRLAQAIQYHLVKDLGPNNRVAKAGDFRVLNDTVMPGVTIEVGFMSNPEEARLLGDSSYRERVAEAIYRGVVRYLAKEDAVHN
jgi:N-acetylmuramoyl-L-alanine amidase